jgi:hypothetical protein
MLNENFLSQSFKWKAVIDQINNIWLPHLNLDEILTSYSLSVRLVDEHVLKRP